MEKGNLPSPFSFLLHLLVIYRNGFGKVVALGLQQLDRAVQCKRKIENHRFLGFVVRTLPDGESQYGETIR